MRGTPGGSSTARMSTAMSIALRMPSPNSSWAAPEPARPARKPRPESSIPLPVASNGSVAGGGPGGFGEWRNGFARPVGA